MSKRHQIGRTEPTFSRGPLDFCLSRTRRPYPLHYATHNPTQQHRQKIDFCTRISSNSLRGSNASYGGAPYGARFESTQTQSTRVLASWGSDPSQLRFICTDAQSVRVQTSPRCWVSLPRPLPKKRPSLCKPQTPTDPHRPGLNNRPPQLFSLRQSVEPDQWYRPTLECKTLWLYEPGFEPSKSTQPT